MFETKVHYKSYKAGKKWLYVAIGVTSLCAGIALTTPVSVEASTATSDAKSTEVVQASANDASTAKNSTDSSGQLADNGQDDSSVNGAKQASAQSNSFSSDDSSVGDDNVTVPGNSTTEETPETKASQAGDESTDPATSESDSQVSNDSLGQVTAPKKLADSTEMTDPMTVIKTGNQQDQSQNKVAASVKVTATNDQGTMTSQDSSLDSQQIGINTQDTSVSATYQITNQTDAKQNLWIFFTLPVYADKTNQTVVASTANADALTANLPTGARLSYITTDGVTHSSYTGFDWATLQELVLQGSLEAGASYTATLPLVMTTNPQERASLATYDYTPDWSVNSVVVSSIAPIQAHAKTDLPTPTPEPTIDTVDPDVTTPVNALSNNPAGKTTESTTAVDATVRLTAKKDGQTSTSLTSNNNLGNYTDTVIDSKSTDLTALLDVTNTTGTVQTVNTYFYLPKYYAENNKTLTSSVAVADSADLQKLIANLPSGLNVSFYVGTTQYKSFDELKAAQPSFQNSDLTILHVSGYLAGDSGYTMALPLISEKNDQVSVKGVSVVRQVSYDVGGTASSGEVHFKIANQLKNVTGHYQAVVVDPDDDGFDYVTAPLEVQEAMPVVGQNQITYNNFYDVGPSATHFYNGGAVTVNYKNAGLADAVNKLGYSLVLDANGQPQESWCYATYVTLATVKGDRADDTDQQIAPAVYIVVRRVLKTQDSNLKVGDGWQAMDNFVSGIDAKNQPLQASDVQVDAIDDPTGILQDGKVTKAGTFKVTYAYQVAPDYNETGKPYMVYRTAIVTVTGDPTTGTDTGTTTPTKPDDGDGTGTGTTTPTKPDDGDGTSTGTTTPTKPDDGDGTGTGTTTPTKPDDGDGTGTGTTTPTKPDDGDGTGTGTTTPTKPDDGDGTGTGTTTPTTPGDGTDTTVTTPTSSVITDGSGDTGTPDITAPTTTTTPNLVTDAAADTVTPEQGTLMTGGDGDKVVKTTTAKTMSVPGTVNAGAKAITQQTAATLTLDKATTQHTATLTTIPTTPSVKPLATSTKLPQTGEQATTSTLAVGLGLILGALGLGGLSRRKQD